MLGGWRSQLVSRSPCSCSAAGPDSCCHRMPHLAYPAELSPKKGATLVGTATPQLIDGLKAKVLLLPWTGGRFAWSRHL